MRCRCFDCDLQRLTFSVRAYREYLELERKLGIMSRLTDKLTRAAGVVKRATDKIESRADAIIAREDSIDRKTDAAFSPHESILSEAESGLDAVERALALVTNGPLPSSGGSQETTDEGDPVHNTRGSDGELIHKD